MRCCTAATRLLHFLENAALVEKYRPTVLLFDAPEGTAAHPIQEYRSPAMARSKKTDSRCRGWSPGTMT